MSQTIKALMGLRELILSGEIAPGERLVEVNLVERLDVSRTPIRAALIRLAEIYLHQDKPEKALVLYQRYLAFDPEDRRQPSLHVNVGCSELPGGAENPVEKLAHPEQNPSTSGG